MSPKDFQASQGGPPRLKALEMSIRDCQQDLLNLTSVSQNVYVCVCACESAGRLGADGRHIPLITSVFLHEMSVTYTQSAGGGHTYTSPIKLHCLNSYTNSADTQRLLPADVSRCTVEHQTML